MNCCSIVEAPWRLPLWTDVLDERAGDAANVDAAVGLEALVLDRDHRLLDDRRDLRRGHDHPVLLAEHPDRVAEVVEQVGALRVLELREAGQRRQVGGDGDEHAEDEGDEPEQQHGEEDQQRSAAASAVAARGRAMRRTPQRAGRLPARAVRGLQSDDRLRSPTGKSTRRVADWIGSGPIAVQSSIGLDARCHRRGRRGSRAARARSAVDSLPEGALAAKLQTARTRGPASCGSSSGSTRRRPTSISVTRSCWASCASSRTPGTGWC